MVQALSCPISSFKSWRTMFWFDLIPSVPRCWFAGNNYVITEALDLKGSPDSKHFRNDFELICAPCPEETNPRCDTKTSCSFYTNNDTICWFFTYLSKLWWMAIYVDGYLHQKFPFCSETEKMRTISDLEVQLFRNYELLKAIPCVLQRKIETSYHLLKRTMIFFLTYLAECKASFTNTN